MQYKRPESVLVVIYDQQGRVLVLQREDDANFWQSVTGTLEADEAPEVTAIREVQEETGIDIYTQGYTLCDCRQTNQYEIRPLWRHRYPPNISVNTEYVFCVEVSGEHSIQLSEHLQYIWLEKEAAISKVWSATNKEAIARFVPSVVNT